RLRQARQADRIAADQIAEVAAVGGGFGQVDAGLAPALGLEQQMLVLQQAAAAGQGGGNLAAVGVGGSRTADGVHARHQRISARADFRDWIWASVVVSVAATSRTSSMPASGAS